jgi:hypothetical protein
MHAHDSIAFHHAFIQQQLRSLSWDNNVHEYVVYALDLNRSQGRRAVMCSPHLRPITTS